ncbi:MAG TPA: DNA methyltransferase [Rhizomicrobium sp.]|nr:DNA methyltransferase [Rhizomicrobium sp.]
MPQGKKHLCLQKATQIHLIEAARDAKPVIGLTHNYYRYPARFSPQFVRAAIEAFTLPGDTVLDPFVGGGTTLVEAMALNRDAIGIDISSLAAFVSEAKTLLLKDSEFNVLSRWASRLPDVVNVHHSRPSASQYEELGYFRNIDTHLYWRLRKCIEQALASAIRLHSENARTIARCAVLRTAQWALDSRKRLPSVPAFRATLNTHAKEVICGARELRTRVESFGTSPLPMVKCFNASTAGFDETDHGRRLPMARLVLTSPPYPGVHVLYHRWQVDGRKETPAPFWIANKLDGAGASYYTLGDRKNPGLRTYFENLEKILTSTVALCDSAATVVQVVAFSEPEWQLEKYLQIARNAGLVERFLPLAGSPDGRLWREVPNRRWYADQRGETNGSQEVVLFHHISPSVTNRRTNRHNKPRPIASRTSTTAPI